MSNILKTIYALIIEGFEKSGNKPNVYSPFLYVENINVRSLFTKR